jgi:hypothetical protein
MCLRHQGHYLDSFHIVTQHAQAANRHRERTITISILTTTVVTHEDQMMGQKLYGAELVQMEARREGTCPHPNAKDRAKSGGEEGDSGRWRGKHGQSHWGMWEEGIEETPQPDSMPNEGIAGWREPKCQANPSVGGGAGGNPILQNDLLVTSPIYAVRRNCKSGIIQGRGWQITAWQKHSCSTAASLPIP